MQLAHPASPTRPAQAPRMPARSHLLLPRSLGTSQWPSCSARNSSQPLLPPGRATVSNKEVLKAKRMTTLGLPKTNKEHRFLKAVPWGGGEKPSVALPLLWEADHHQHVATTWAGSTGQVTRFTKSLSDAVATDTVLSAWLTSKQKVFQLVAGVPAKPHLRWAVQVAPAAGEDVFFREFFGRRTCSVWLAGIKRRKQLRRNWFLQTFEAPHPGATGTATTRVPTSPCPGPRRLVWNA